MSKRHLKVLQSVREIVQAFGGTKATADWAGVGMPAVSNWLAEDEIPPAWHYRMDLELRSRGFAVDPRAFGIQEAS